MSEVIRGPEPLGPRVCRLNVMPGHRLDLTFTNGERRIYDASPLLEWPAYKPLRNDALFGAARVEYGSVCWPGDIDCCPDRLYRDSVALDSDYTKVTPAEVAALDAAEAEIARGETVADDEIDWDAD